MRIESLTDQELDTSTGIYDYGARLYDPVIGRFITPDSTVQDPSDPQTLNRYSYCRNNPLIYVDPNGQSFLSKFISGFVGGVVTALTGEPWIGGMVSGMLDEALENKECNLGSIVLAGVTGGVTGYGGEWVYANLGKEASYALMAIGGGIAYADGGVQGLVDYSGSILGNSVGYIGASAAQTYNYIKKDLVQDIVTAKAHEFEDVGEVHISMDGHFDPKGNKMIIDDINTQYKESTKYAGKPLEVKGEVNITLTNRNIANRPDLLQKQFNIAGLEGSFQLNDFIVNTTATVNWGNPYRLPPITANVRWSYYEGLKLYDIRIGQKHAVK